MTAFVVFGFDNGDSFVQFWVLLFVVVGGGFCSTRMLAVGVARPGTSSLILRIMCQFTNFMQLTYLPVHVPSDVRVCGRVHVCVWCVRRMDGPRRSNSFQVQRSCVFVSGLFVVSDCVF